MRMGMKIQIVVSATMLTLSILGCGVAREEVSTSVQNKKINCESNGSDLSTMEKLCTDRNDSACDCLTMFYFQSRHLPKSTKYKITDKTIQIIETNIQRLRHELVGACQSGKTSACFQIGSLLAVTGLETTNETESFKYYSLACEGDDLRACISVAQRWSTGRFGAPRKDPEKAAEIWKRLCDLGSDLGCSPLARHLQEKAEKGNPELWPEVIKYLELSCERGSSSNCASLSEIYGDGKHVDKNLVRARRYLSKGCAELKPGEWVPFNLCQQLASMWELGIGGPKDEKRALEYYRRDCDLAKTIDCSQCDSSTTPIPNPSCDAANALENSSIPNTGIGAKTVHTILCENGSGQDCVEAIALWMRDDLGMKDPSKARPLAVHACKNRGLLRTLALTCFQAGSMCSNGEGGPVDIETAYRSFRMACMLRQYCEKKCESEQAEQPCQCDHIPKEACNKYKQAKQGIKNRP